MMLSLASGAIAGAFHVLSGPDHVAAVAPLALSARRRAWGTGFTWGLGHASGVVAVAVMAVALRESLPPIADLSAWGERLVGGALIALGLWSVARAARVRTGAHAHGAVRHDHVAVSAGPAWVRRLGHAHAAFFIGALHGVAGSSHFFGVLPALALPTPQASFAYITAFGIGTVATMTAFAGALGRVGTRGAARSHRALMATTGVLAIVVGAVWISGAGV
jgi:sulfite exporter TauE/SafE